MKRFLINQHKIFTNISGLYLIQFGNYILPVLIIPLLSRNLGSENYGKIIFAQSLIQYCWIIIDYGFNITATQQISVNRGSNIEIIKIVNRILFIKLILFLIVSMIFIGYSLIFVSDYVTKIVLLFSLIGLLGQVLTPLWYFQGIEKASFISFITFFPRLLGTALLFVVINNPNDTIYAVMIQSLSIVSGGSIAIIICLYQIKFHLTKVEFTELVNELRSGLPVFISQVSTVLFSNTTIFLLGIFVNFSAVTHFSIGEKIVRAFTGLVMPISIAIFPKVSYLVKISKYNALVFIRKVLLLGLPCFLTISVLIYLNANQLTKIISGGSNSEVELVIRTLSLLPTTVFIDNIYGTQVMLNFGMGTLFMFSVLLPGVISVILSITFLPNHGINAASYITSIAMILTMLSMIILVNLNGIGIFFSVKLSKLYSDQR